MSVNNQNLANKQKVVVVGAGPVGALAALYAADRGDNVEVYELRGGIFQLLIRLKVSKKASLWIRHFSVIFP